MPPPEIPGARRVDPGEQRAVPDIHAALEGQGVRLVNPPPESPVAGLPPAVGAGLIGLNRGARHSLPIAGGMVGGMLTGANPLGVGLGAAGGELIGQAYDAFFDVPEIDELPEELRPFAIGGEVLGGSIAPGMLPLAAGRGRTGLRFIDRIIESAQRHPGRYTALEGSAAAGAAVGTAVASEFSSGNPLAEFTGGLAGAFANPGSRAVQGGGLLSDAFKRASSALSRRGLENRAAAELRRILEETGEDPAQLSMRLRGFAESVENAGRLGLRDPRTTAQLSGSEGLQLLEAELSRRSSRFGRESAQRGAESLTAVRKVIASLAATGDPQALREAAQLRQRYFEGLIADRLRVAEREAAEAAQRITDDTPAARAALGQQLEQILDTALSDARRTERYLWGQVPQRAPVIPRATVAESNRIAVEELLPEETLHPLAKRFVERISEGSTTVQEMLRFRARMLEEARKLSAEGDAATARRLGLLAESALEDLESMSSFSGMFDDVPDIKNPLSQAREYSRTLNDVFTRSFVGQAQATAKSGARRIPPELMVRRALAGGSEAAAMRLRELERAVRLGSPEAADEMLAIQQRMLRLMASDIVDPNTGLASGPRLGRFFRANQELLDQFPEVREILRDVDTANRWLTRMQDSANRAQKQIQREAAFAKVANAENPVREVERIVRSANPQQQFRQLARLAHTQGESAVLGFRSAALQEAFERAGGDSAEFSFTSFRNALMEPRRPGQPSVMDMLRSTGVMDADTASRLGRLLNEADQIEQALRTKPQLESMLQGENFLSDFVNRMVGARLGSGMAGMSGQPGGYSIVAAGAGSRLARNVMDKVPTGKVQDVLIEAAENPDFMATLLQRTPTLREKIQVTRRAHAWLVSLGLAEANRLQQQQEGAQQ